MAGSEITQVPSFALKFKKHRASFRTPGVIVSNIKALAPDQS